MQLDLSCYRDDAKSLVRDHFRNDEGQPFELTDGQADIFNAIWKRRYPRNIFVCPTQYGKSSVTSMALLCRVASYPEKWTVVAPGFSRARIIMDYAAKHALESDLIRRALILPASAKIEHLGWETSKSKLTFRVADSTRFGELMILSAAGHRKSDIESALSGFGSPNVLLDESPLLDDTQYSMVTRMIGGHADNYLGEIGNPWRRNHFFRSFENEGYNKIFIDWRQGVDEGRYTEAFIEEQSKVNRLFSVLYGCQFPDSALADDRGWTGLLAVADLERALRDADPVGEPRLGLDVGGGSDPSCWILRYDNYARILYEDTERDTMVTVNRTLALLREYRVSPKNVFVDATGIGAGVADRLAEIFKVQKISNAPRCVVAGESQDIQSTPRKELDRYRNRRAQNYWRMVEWLRERGSLDPDDDWSELLDVRYRVVMGKRIDIEPKEMMRSRGIRSPNRADALMLTFDTPEDRKLFHIMPRSRVGIRVPGMKNWREDRVPLADYAEQHETIRLQGE